MLWGDAGCPGCLAQLLHAFDGMKQLLLLLLLTLGLLMTGCPIEPPPADDDDSAGDDDDSAGDDDDSSGDDDDASDDDDAAADDDDGADDDDAGDDDDATGPGGVVPLGLDPVAGLVGGGCGCSGAATGSVGGLWLLVGLVFVRRGRQCTS